MLMVLQLVCPVFAQISEPTAVPYGLEARVPWTTSRLRGSPEPPPPFVVVNAFPDIEWERPLYAKREPNSTDLVVVLQGGEENRPAQVLRVRDAPNVTETKLLLEYPGRLIYGLEFHPDYGNNRLLYVFSNGPTGEPERQNRISRFTVDEEFEGARICRRESEQIILEWRSMGHDGGDLCFGPDGMLYITSGDGTSDSDNWLSAQDATNLLGAVLRIDVDRPDGNQRYSIPRDNPFLEVPDARGELWAIGLRNPWRMSADAATGQIWVGNNGQDLWETVHLLRRGENYGWSVYEGSHPFYANRNLGPGKLALPTFEHHHSEARSLTGGIVYDGTQWPELTGAYIYGDYSTGKIWAARHDGHEVVWHREIADTTLQIAGFANSHRGDVLVVDLAGGIFRLQANSDPQGAALAASFPRKLSETGIFVDVATQQLAPGVIPYSVNCEGWNDGAQARRFLAIPGEQQIEYRDNRGWEFPNGSVLVQTLSMASASDENPVPRYIETRVLLRDQGEWSGYSYQWNAEQKDAFLVDRGGGTVTLDTSIGQPNERIEWQIPSRAECMSCHSRAVNYVLGLTELQMNRMHDYGKRSANQLSTLDHLGLFSEPLRKPIDERQHLVNPYDSSASVESRVRSYLHTNCSCCHVEAGGGNARMELEYRTPLEKMNVVGHFPQHDAFGITQPRIVAPGRPDDSVMLARLSRRGRGQMPPLVSNRVDPQAVELLREWIRSMEPDRKLVRDWSVEELRKHLPEVLQGRSLPRGKQVFREAGCNQCHRIQNEFAGIGPNLTGVSKRLALEEILVSIIEPSKNVAPAYAETIVVTHSGEVIRGRVESETEDRMVVRGQGAFAVARELAKVDIDERRLSTISMMPEDTLNYFEIADILDLLAYLVSDVESEQVTTDSH